MTYQPLNQKAHFSQTTKVFQMLSHFADESFSDEDLLIAADEFVQIGSGKIAAEKIKEYSQTPNHYSRDTYSMMTNSPWKCVPTEYEYDEESSPELSFDAQQRFKNLMSGDNYVI